MPERAVKQEFDVDPRFGFPETIFFGLGAQKSATTWLSNYLSDHPEVCFPPIKEQNYWHVVDGGGSPGRNLEAHRKRRQELGPFIAFLRDLGWSRQAKRYRGARLALAAADHPGPPHTHYADSLFAGGFANRCRCAGEISPSYASLSPETYAQMLGMAANVKFLFLMRDPVSRFVSGLRHSVRKSGQGDTLTQEEFDALVDSELSDPDGRALRHSRYDLTIQTVESVVPPDRLGYFFFETMFDQAVIDEICDFLGVSKQSAPLSKIVHVGSAKHVRISDADRLRVAAALTPTYRAMRAKFGGSLPAVWTKSEALITDQKAAHA